MKKYLGFLIILFISSDLYSQKVAFINESLLLKSISNYEHSIKKMDSLRMTIQDEIKSDQNKLLEKINSLLNPYNFNNDSTIEEILSKLSEMDKKKFVLLQEENALLLKQIETKKEDYQQIYEQKVGTILERVNKVVKEYCKKNKIEVLYKIDQLQPAIAYYDESKDITETVIKLVNGN